MKPPGVGPTLLPLDNLSNGRKQRRAVVLF